MKSPIQPSASDRSSDGLGKPRLTQIFPGGLAGFAVLVFLTLAVPFSRAQSTWNGAGTDSNWSTAANWGGVAPVSGAGLALTFSGTTRLTPVMNASYSVGQLTFSSTAGAFNLTGGNTLTLFTGITDNSTVSSVSQTITSAVALGATNTWTSNGDPLVIAGTLALGSNSLTVAGSGKTTFNGVVSGSGASSITKSGSGTLTLAGTNTFTGPVNVNAGIVAVTNSSGLGTSTTTTVASGAALDLSGGITVNESAINVAGTGISGTGAILNVSGNNTISNAVSLSADSTLGSTAGTATYAGGLNLSNGGTAYNLAVAERATRPFRATSPVATAATTSR